MRRIVWSAIDESASSTITGTTTETSFTPTLSVPAALLRVGDELYLQAVIEILSASAHDAYWAIRLGTQGTTSDQTGFPVDTGAFMRGGIRYTPLRIGASACWSMRLTSEFWQVGEIGIRSTLNTTSALSVDVLFRWGSSTGSPQARLNRLSAYVRR